MTEPVQKISRTSDVGQRKGYRDRLSRIYDETSKHDSEQDGDQVDISEEARSRAEGRYRKTILEHLEEP